ncbi:MAG: DUF4232 domain-containing protein [Acidimicrobiales bacterium]
MSSVRERVALLALSAIITSACGVNVARGSSASTSRSTASSSTSIVQSATSSSAPGGNKLPPACASSQLTITDGRNGVGMGHSGGPILFRNHGSKTCFLKGYPGVEGLDASGNQVTQAVRTPLGYLGGLPTMKALPPVVILKPGDTASALVEGTDVPSGGSAQCPILYGLEVTAPNTHHSTKLQGAPGDCSVLQIHPVVPGTTGSEVS